jgi:hypothetical protein
VQYLFSNPAVAIFFCFTAKQIKNNSCDSWKLMNINADVFLYVHVFWHKLRIIFRSSSALYTIKCELEISSTNFFYQDGIKNLAPSYFYFSGAELIKKIARLTPDSKRFAHTLIYCFRIRFFCPHLQFILRCVLGVSYWLWWYIRGYKSRIERNS